MTKTVMIALSEIFVPPGPRLRKLRPDLVDALAESMKRQGQLQNIVLCPFDDDQYPYRIVAGYHRLMAAKMLKWDNIRCTILNSSNAHKAELVEIDENLVRAKLSPAEEARHIRRRKELYEKLHPETKQGGAPGKAGGGKETKPANLATFAEDTAQKTGKSRRTVERVATRGKKVKDKILGDIAGTSLDKGEEIDALAKLPDDEQQKLAERAKAGEKVSAKQQMIAAVQEASPDVSARQMLTGEYFVRDFEQAFRPIESFCNDNLTNDIVPYVQPQTAEYWLPRIDTVIDGLQKLRGRLANISRSSGDFTTH